MNSSAAESDSHKALASYTKAAELDAADLGADGWRLVGSCHDTLG